MSVVLLTRATFRVVLFYFCVLSLGCSSEVVSTSTSDWLERLISEMTYNVLMGMLNPTHSLTHSLTHSRPWRRRVCARVCVRPTGTVNVPEVLEAEGHVGRQCRRSTEQRWVQRRRRDVSRGGRRRRSTTHNSTEQTEQCLCITGTITDKAEISHCTLL